MKIDIGCGSKKKEGFVGVDQYAMEGVDHVCKIGEEALPFENDSVEEVHCSHFLEHLSAKQRTSFMNELYRVMKNGAQASVIVPHWNSNRAYGDPTHQWPPVSEMYMYYLSKDWRKSQAPHTDSEWNPDGFNCDFEATWGNAPHPALATRNTEYQQYAQTWYKEAIQDLHINLKKK